MITRDKAVEIMVQCLQKIFDENKKTVEYTLDTPVMEILDSFDYIFLMMSVEVQLQKAGITVDFNDKLIFKKHRTATINDICEFISTYEK